MSTVVRTVLGDIDPSSLGHVQPHEHLFVNLGLPLPDDADEFEHARQWAPIEPSNYYSTRREHTLQDLLLDDVAIAEQSIREFRSAGGGTVVDVTSIGLGRNASALEHVARRTGVNIIMGSSYYYGDYHPKELRDLSEEQITDSIVSDVTIGVDGSGIKAGVIGEVGMAWPHDPVEERVLSASARAQRETGAALVIHPGRHHESPMSAVRTATANGATPEKVIVSHIDRTIFDRLQMLDLARTGCILAFDLFGQESSYYSLSPIDMPNDAARVEHIMYLTEQGFADQIVISQDICHKTNLRHYGGEGYTHILDHVIPLMRRKQVSEETITTITVDNPARILAFNRS